MKDERKEAYGDAIYAAWRSGLNPDLIDRESVDRHWYETYDREMTAYLTVEEIRPRREYVPEEEEQFPPEQFPDDTQTE